MYSLRKSGFLKANSMSHAAAIVLSTVNVPYGTKLSAHELARSVTDVDQAQKTPGQAFSFFSEVSLPLQKEFASEMGLDIEDMIPVANFFSSKAGYKLPLAG